MLGLVAAPKPEDQDDVTERATDRQGPRTEDEPHNRKAYYESECKRPDRITGELVAMLLRCIDDRRIEHFSLFGAQTGHDRRDNASR
jgi:hypothetical protein